MKESIEKYIQDISEKFKHAETSELGYRSDFESLLQKIFESIKYKRFNHDAKAKEGNKPDFAVLSGDVPLVYIETKDIGVSLDKVEKSEQMSRYYGYANLVLTDYLEFRFYRNGLPYGEPIKIANYNLKNRSVDVVSENYELLSKTLLEFTQSYKEPIKSGKHLSKIMAGKAQRIRDNIRQFLSAELENKTELVKLYESIKKFLVHDLTVDSFADMYAQTLVYGLFIARFNDTTLDSFTRSEARDLIPNSNPFLHRFFDHIAGTDFDTRLKYIVDELCEVFSHSNIEELLKQFSNEDLWGKAHKKPDPVIYFYENFLKEYDPVLRKKMGAYYTPEPVVQFIVKAVDDILKKDFGLTKGLGDTSKTKDGIHKVQILDPATGTGTFISAIIRSIYKSFKENKQEGRWPSYVQNDLLPRLYGFEIMMTPYTIAHLKLSMAFKETGFKYFNSKRLGIYLTNALEGESAQQDMFSAVGLSESIAEESIEASKIKNEKPVMVVIGNPPYSVSSQNVNPYTQKLIEVYKKDLILKNTQPLSDDYVKFIRLAEVLINKNKSGVIAYISNRSFLEGIIHKSMRTSLIDSFDEIYILDLNGDATMNQGRNSKDNDQNVFDIKQGVAISIFIKKENRMSEKKLHYYSIRGNRSTKFDFLNNSKLVDIKFKELKTNSQFNFFVYKDLVNSDYEKFVSLDQIFNIHSSAIATSDDDNLISEQKDNEFKIPFSYRPFDDRYINYDLRKVHGNRYNHLVKYLINNDLDSLYENISLGCSKNITTENFSSVLVSKGLIERKFCDYSRGPHVFPLYTYSNSTRISNINNDFKLGITRIIDGANHEEIFNYIYAILYSPSYREKYNEFLKIDFPRIPYPKNKDQFDKLAKFGLELRELHLLESPKLNSFITSYRVEGSDTIEKVEYKNGNVYINEAQYFGDVPEVAWNFYIGGYQPAQKWLRDRKGRQLTNDDIEHYQKIIVALIETDKVMKEIDEAINI